MCPRAAIRACSDRLEWNGNADGRGRHIILLPQPFQEIQTRVRRDQDTPEWQEHYAIRAGCAATVSETVHAHGLRHCRYHGIAKAHVQHVPTAAGADIVRLSECFPPGSTPTRHPCLRRSRRSAQCAFARGRHPSHPGLLIRNGKCSGSLTAA
ncbi:transposase [Streptomyces sp. MMG1121]|uniref:transposase n=1 Tax=Streptomyces sp. MMG1121 TaxID=1415544 RepID=UPI0006B02D1A|nr:hypothetical protein ADK64_32855 [Streptomyces sp. MMG1121]